jgi:hypothetical protein
LKKSIAPPVLQPELRAPSVAPRWYADELLLSSFTKEILPITLVGRSAGRVTGTPGPVWALNCTPPTSKPNRNYRHERGNNGITP